MTQTILLTNGSVVTPDGILEKGEVFIEDGVIREVGTSIQRVADQQIDAHGGYVLPGFIDMHIHGAAGADVMDATEEALQTMADVLPKEGTTSFLATSMTQAPEAIETALKNAAAFTTKAGQAQMLGVHLEGPFVSPKRAGAQPLEYICPPDAEQFDAWQQAAQGKIRMVTLAPEVPNGLSFIRKLAAEGIVASMGHTDATIAQMEEAAQAGAVQATHLYNQMSPFHHREPGAIGGALLVDELCAEVIPDFIHSHPKAVELAYRVKGADRLILITDAMRAKGLEPGEYDLGGQPVHVSETDARLSDGTLAGSILTMEHAVKNVVRILGISPLDVAKISSGNAARQLGLAKKGSLIAGNDADVVILDKEWTVKHTICGGVVGYEHNEEL
ncbi:N-acetylglucosamine-6-phosphate deacetylase [Lysinibacillus sphaericus]|nr:N-acetylglucosamine-6-phosphate deacetylase [Lysinibacillus sphaericus]